MNYIIVTFSDFALGYERQQSVVELCSFRGLSDWL